MKELFISTNLGKIAVYQKTVANTIPLIFLHGVYYDHNLWNYYSGRITDCTVIAIDMPHHGKSKAITKKNWNMADCASMLLEIIASLGYEQVFAIGHSWGSMTIIRAAVKEPTKFRAIGLCNMPIEKGTLGKRITFGLQHLVLPFRSFYTKQVAKAMFSEENRRTKPEIADYLEASMSLLTNKEVRKTDSAVITKVDDGIEYLDNLKVTSLALKGDKDYVPKPKNMDITIVEGAHTSPLEQPEEVLLFVKKVLEK